MIDFENLPIDIAGRWPEFLQNKKELQAVAYTIEEEFKKLRKETDRVYRNHYVMTADADGLARFERLPNINLKPRDDSTLEDRRMAILAKMQTRLPYTKRRLKQLLTALLGEGMFELDVRTSEYMVYVTVELKRKNQVNAIADLVRRAIPANMDYKIQVRYNQYYMLTKFTYAELEGYTYEQLKTDPEIKDIFLERGGEII